MDSVVQVKGLQKVYGSTIAVDEISFEVFPGEIFGMVGPNGAGKTTTIECVGGLRIPDKGLIRVLGMDPQRDRQILREKTGMQLQQSNLPGRIRVWEALDLYSSFYPHAVEWNTLIANLGLEDKRNTFYSKLSGGQKQRLFIALALLPDPQLVFLDELTTGLDPQARRNIWGLIREVQKRGRTVILTTHFMEEAEYLCDRVAILDHGKIVAMDSPSALIHNLRNEDRVIFTVNGILPPEFIKALGKEMVIEIQGEKVIIRGNNNREIPLVSEIVNLLTKMKISFHDLHTEQATLEDVFLQLTGREMRE